MSKKTSKKKLNMQDYANAMSATWCAGCGNHGISMAFKQALVKLQIPPHQIFGVWGIGCSCNGGNWLNVYGAHTLHGRALPVATGAKLVNPKLTVVAQAGDGDAYGIGLEHLIHACRRNLNITYIVHNNQIYGLTTGQASPTSDKGTKTKSTPCGVIEKPINPLALALSSDATYIARGFAGDLEQLTDLIKNGIKHKGFALIDVLQPCVSFNKINTYDWVKKRVYKIKKPYTLRKQAYAKALEWGQKIPTGLFFKERRLSYSDEIKHLKEGESVARHDISKVSINNILQAFA